MLRVRNLSTINSSTVFVAQSQLRVLLKDLYLQQRRINKEEQVISGLGTLVLQ